MHEVGARHTISSLNLSKMLFDQIGTCSMVLMVPDRSRVISLLVVMGFLDLLLEPELFKEINVGQAGAKTFPAELLVLKSKAHTHDDLLELKWNIYAQIAGPILHSIRFADGRDQLLKAFLVKTTE